MRTTDILQFTMFGMEEAGKTTLLYRLKIPQWKREDIKVDISLLREKKDTGVARGGGDPTYHYEEMYSSRHKFKYGIWEVPGNEVMVRQWPLFYRYNRINAVIFVVDAWSKNMFDLDKIDQARYWLHFLLNEDELRCAAFVLVLNVKQLENEEKDPREEAKEKAIHEMLGVPEIESQPIHGERFYKFSCNCADIDRIMYPKWEDCLRFISEVYWQKGEGSFWGRSDA